MRHPREPRTHVIGVLGGIASGKSAVARRLAGPDGLVLDADAIAHEVLVSEALAALVAEHFGPGALDAEGRVDRGALARLVFADPDAPGRGALGSEEAARNRKLLEGWTHPAVRARILERLAEARASGIPRVALDVPLLLENDHRHGLVSECDALVYVETDPADRDRRARETRGWKPGELAPREATQLPQSEKRSRADFTILNEGSLADLEQRVREVLSELEAR